MKHIIKLTEQQLREIDDSPFNYLNDKPSGYKGTEVTVNGPEMCGLEDMNPEPRTGDEIGDVPVNGNPFRGKYGVGVRRTFESDEHHIDSFYNNTSNTNGLVDNKPDNDLTTVPQTVIEKLNLLIDKMREKELRSVQCNAVLERLMTQMKMSDVNTPNQQGYQTDKAVTLPRTVIDRINQLVDVMNGDEQCMKQCVAVLKKVMSVTDTSKSPYLTKENTRKVIGKIGKTRLSPQKSKQLSLRAQS